MSMATEAKVDRHENELRVISAALNAIVERLEIMESHFVNNNAVVEGDEVQTRATRNGKLKSHR